MCDEGSANYCAIWQVYGEIFTNARVVGCQWHFKNDVNRHSKDVSPDMRELFMPALQLQSIRSSKVTWMTLET